MLALEKLIEIANRYRSYGDKDLLKEQFFCFKERFEAVKKL